VCRVVLIVDQIPIGGSASCDCDVAAVATSSLPIYAALQRLQRQPFVVVQRRVGCLVVRVQFEPPIATPRVCHLSQRFRVLAKPLPPPDTIEAYTYVEEKTSPFAQWWQRYAA
jgi:hypothetical protein